MAPVDSRVAFNIISTTWKSIFSGLEYRIHPLPKLTPFPLSKSRWAFITSVLRMTRRRAPSQMRTSIRYSFPNILQIALFYQRRQIEGCPLRADRIERQTDLQIIDNRAGRFLAGLTIDPDYSLFRLADSLDLHGEERRAFESPGEPVDIGL